MKNTPTKCGKKNRELNVKCEKPKDHKGSHHATISFKFPWK